MVTAPLPSVPVVPPLPTCKAPALIVVVPVFPFAPATRRIPSPLLIISPAPVTRPLIARVSALPMSNVVLPLLMNARFPREPPLRSRSEKLVEMVVVAPPTVSTAPLRTEPAPSVRLLAPPVKRTAAPFVPGRPKAPPPALPPIPPVMVPVFVTVRPEPTTPLPPPPPSPPIALDASPPRPPSPPVMMLELFRLPPSEKMIPFPPPPPVPATPADAMFPPPPAVPPVTCA